MALLAVQGIYLGIMPSPGRIPEVLLVVLGEPGMELAAVAAAAAKSLVVLAGMGVQVPRGMSLSRIP
jgi:hypothetical protein